MGYKKTNYEIKEMGLTIPEAYAQIVQLSTDIDGNATAVFEVQQNRESIAKMRPFESVRYGVKVDKSLPIHKQVYEKAKESIFKGWDDDIVEVESDGEKE